MSKTVIKPNQETLGALDQVKSLLAEQGYFIGNVAPNWQRHNSDFIAAAKPNPNACMAPDVFLVRATLRDYITVLCLSHNDGLGTVKLKQSKKRIGRPILIRRNGFPKVKCWKDVVDKKTLETLERFI